MLYFRDVGIFGVLIPQVLLTLDSCHPKLRRHISSYTGVDVHFKYSSEISCKARNVCLLNGD